MIITSSIIEDIVNYTNIRMKINAERCTLKNTGNVNCFISFNEMYAFIGL